MPTSQNGYPANNRAFIATATVPGTTVRLPVRIGAAGDLLIWAAARWNREVEPLVDGWNWGYAERAIRGGSQLSNHASGTAIDLNAPRHPLGTVPAANFTSAQIAAVRRIVADAQGCLRWGGDYTGRKDPMHLEIVKSEAECGAVLARLGGKTPPAPKPQEDDVQLPEIALGDGIPDKRDTGPNDPGRKRWAVVSVQALLNVRGLSKQVVVDGQFGSETESMVKELQRRAGVPQTGRVDAKTWPWLIWNDAPDHI